MANDGEATLAIKLKDAASSGIKSLKAALGDLASAAAGVTLSIGTFVAAAIASVHAFAEQERAVTRLGNALKNQGDASAKTRDDLVAYAGELQKVTTFSDDVLIENQALLVSFGLMGDELKGALRASMDLSIGRNIDLATAAMLVGKAYQGNTETLKRYGIEINGTLPPAQRFQATLEAINGTLGGSAAAAADTYLGRLTILKNRFGELQENLGLRLMPVAERLIDVTNRGLDAWERYGESVKKLLTPMGQLALLRAKLRGLIGGEDVGLQWAEPPPLPKTPKGGTAPGAGGATDEEGLKLAERVRQRLEIQRAGEVERIGMEAEAIAQRLEAHNQFELAKEIRTQATFDTLAAQRAADLDGEKQTMAARKVATMNALTYLASLQTAKTKEIAAVGKAAAIATTIINAHMAAGQAMAAFAAIPPLALAMGAMMEAAGMAQAAQIAGVPLAEGGIVLPRAGGTLATLAEAGQAEAVIPLGDSRAQRALGGSNETHVHIHAANVVADPMSVREFAQRIDEELFRLQRNRKSLL